MFKNYMWFFDDGEIKLKIKSYSENKSSGDFKICKKTIKMININGESLGVYTPKELKNLGFFTKTIYSCCDKKFITTQGYKWEWAQN